MLDVIGKRAIKQQSPIIKDNLETALQELENDGIIQNNCLTEKGFWAVYDTTQEEAIESAKQFILDNLKDTLAIILCWTLLVNEPLNNSRR